MGRYRAALTACLLLATGVDARDVRPPRWIASRGTAQLHPSPAGYAAMGAAVPLALFTGKAAAVDPRPAIALTFDDIPAHGPLPPGQTRAGVIRAIAGAPAAARAPAFGFLNAGFGLDDARTEAMTARARAQAQLGRDIPHVLLLHVGAFDAHMLPRVLDLYRSMGFRFVSLAEAQADPFYAAAIDPTLPGPSATLAGPPSPLAAPPRHLFLNPETI